ncbi:MAG TPA: nuclear transport factor 2 family protein [Pseudonocardia sp.]|uniref:nuclear transport factor 2 family protein n=1 Tax=Pseudonocardia sp. TaxID=60912 RepID=UPI002C88B046|nr:nuclear transport factor 2 family protein [Pseudonocardia sp.]HTF54126.1 nuclear transport factor 2 family protein [Pseudonocardia sp.]
MASSDLEIMRGVYDAFARRDLDTIRAAIHPDFVMEQSTALPWGGVRHGPDGFFAFLGALLSHVDPTVAIEDLFDAGDHVVQVGHTSGTVLDTGAPFRAREVHVWQLRDGLITSYRVLIDVPAMLAALQSAGQGQLDGG